MDCHIPSYFSAERRNIYFCSTIVNLVLSLTLAHIYTEVNNANESNSMKKIEKLSNSKVMNFYNGKSMLKCSVFSKPSSRFHMLKSVARTTMDVLIK